MPDKKLTDNEIVKTLECCKTDKSCDKCEYEPTEHQIGTVGCSHELMKDTLDLIKRLQAENKKLKLECANAQFAKYKAEFEEFKTEIKADAYKECIEKVKEEIAEALKSNYMARDEREQKTPIYTHTEFMSYCSGKIDCLRGLDDFLDNLLKELVGEG